MPIIFANAVREIDVGNVVPFAPHAWEDDNLAFTPVGKRTPWLPRHRLELKKRAHRPHPEIRARSRHAI
jgi:hypothetical protein